MVVRRKLTLTMTVNRQSYLNELVPSGQSFSSKRRIARKYGDNASHGTGAHILVWVRYNIC